MFTEEEVKHIQATCPMGSTPWRLCQALLALHCGHKDVQKQLEEATRPKPQSKSDRIWNWWPKWKKVA